MTLEVATYINDLQPVNPPGTDPTSQGDDHLRLVKQVLQNTFVGASRQWQIPSAKAVSTNYTVLKTDGESTLYVATAGGAVVLTLPALVALDAGWKIRLCKTSFDANPIFVTPPSGTINSGGATGLARARRCIPGVITEAIWDGTSWFATRALALPIGSCVEFHGSALPAGYEWPNGQTLSSAANYPEYNQIFGGLATRDKRGFTAICLDNLGGVSAGRLPNGFITGTAVGNTGGIDGFAITVAQMPSHRHGMQVTDPGHTHNMWNSAAEITTGGVTSFATPTYITNSIGTATSSSSTGVFVQDGSGNVNVTTFQGANNIHSNLQPSIMVSNILVVE